MPRETQARKRHRVALVCARLREVYPDAHCELRFRTPLELLVATVLSAQCTDVQVNLVTAGLFENYTSARDYAGAGQEELEIRIRRIGLFRNKAKAIRSMCQLLLERHGGEVPRTMEQLTALPGVGRKTANVVLGNAFGINEGIVVDTHVGRLAQCLGFTSEGRPDRIEADLVRLVPQSDWTLFSHWLIWHGRRRCFARHPDCARCEIASLCPTCPRAASPAA